MTDEIERSSYTAADSMPVKVIQNKDIVELIADKGIIPPTHVQFIPTNKCNMSCNFCSCDEEDRDVEMPLYKIESLIPKLAVEGTKAVTITGGGEPTMHPSLGTMMRMFYDNDIKIGLVSNGLNLHKVDYDYLNLATWCRISNGDFRKFSDKYKSNLEKVVKGCPDVDWAFSHVTSDKPNIEEISRIVNFANDNNFTHVRLVADLFNPENVSMKYVKKMLDGKGIDDSKVIYQGRKNPEKGMDCYIAYLKPLIGADGGIYRCCFEENEAVVIEDSKGLIDNVQIKDVKMEDKCFSEQGKEEVVYKEKTYKDITYEIELQGGRSIKVSDDHDMLQGINFEFKNKRKKELENYELKITEAKDLKVGDYIPVSINFKDNYQSLDISSEICRLLGYFVAEGYSDGKNELRFCFGKEDKYLDDLKYCLMKEGIPYKIYTYDSTYQFSIRGDGYKKIMKYDCGRVSHNKRIPKEIFNSKKHCKEEFLKAYVREDCHLYKPTKNYDGYKLQMSTVSRKLSSDLMLLLSMLGVVGLPKLERRKGTMEIEGRKVNVKDIYRINIAGYYNLSKMENIIELKIPKPTRDVRRALAFPKTENIMFLPIKNIYINESESDFYDITVVPNHRLFIGNGQLLVKQCGSQYALKEPSRKLPKELKMGTIDAFHSAMMNYESAKDGNQCDKCYYGNYNRTLESMLGKTKHKDFV